MFDKDAKHIYSRVNTTVQQLVVSTCRPKHPIVMGSKLPTIGETDYYLCVINDSLKLLESPSSSPQSLLAVKKSGN